MPHVVYKIALEQTKNSPVPLRIGDLRPGEQIIIPLLLDVERGWNVDGRIEYDDWINITEAYLPFSLTYIDASSGKQVTVPIREPEKGPTTLGNWTEGRG